MAYQINIKSMSVDNLNNRTVFGIELVENLGFAVRTLQTLNITVDQKFTNLGAEASDAVAAYVKMYEAQLGLV